MPQKSGLPKKPSPKSDLGRDDKKNKKKSSQSRQQPQRPPHDAEADQDENQIDLSTTIPLTLQQLLLNVFKSALLSTDGQEWNINNKKNNDEDDNDKNQDTALNENENETETEQTSSDIKSIIQTIKSHLYNRDFDSAFTDANEDLLRAYALRWSASRALGYAGILKAMLKYLLFDGDDRVQLENGTGHIVSIGGGAGAEIVALAAVWRDLMEESALADAVTAVSLDDGAGNATEKNNASTAHPQRLSVTAVDIADWSSVINRLSSTIRSPAVRGSKTHPAPLIQPIPSQSREDDESATSESFTVNFERADVLSLPGEELKGLLSPGNTATIMVTLMFTLNELFSTSMAKTTAFLLHLTDLLYSGTVLLVVDSPGSYSTLTLGKGSSKQDSDNATSTSTSTSATQERRYPMKFLLDHTLLSVAKGKWERIYSQDSRWWRRDAARLGYDVGEGAGLEDMRFQVHIYRRLGN